MYTFNRIDQRLQRLMEASIFIFESFVGFEQKYQCPWLRGKSCWLTNCSSFFCGGGGKIGNQKAKRFAQLHICTQFIVTREIGGTQQVPVQRDDVCWCITSTDWRNPIEYESKPE